MEQQYFYKGKGYRSLEEMPPEARQAYERVQKMLEDSDGNGVPDAFEGGGEGMFLVQRGPAHVTANGKPLADLGRLPGWVQKLLQLAIAKDLRKLKSGLNDSEWLEQVAERASGVSRGPAIPEKNPQPGAPPYEDVSSSRRIVQLLLLAALLLALAAALFLLLV